LGTETLEEFMVSQRIHAPVGDDPADQMQNRTSCGLDHVSLPSIGTFPLYSSLRPRRWRFFSDEMLVS
jgi:hypothetical protein